MLKDENIRKKNVYNLLLFITGIVFCFWLGEDGPILMPDSEIFLNPGYYVKSSYLVYVSFLKVCKTIFSIDFYLQGIWLMQSILAIAITIVVTEYIRKEYKFTYTVAYIIYCMMYLPYLYNLPENVVTHHILTEAIAIPLMEIFFLLILKFFNEKKALYMLLAIGVGILLVKTRSQLCFILIVILILVMLPIIVSLVKRLNKKEKIIFASSLFAGLLVVISLGLSIIPVLVQKNSWQQLTDAVLGRTLCTIEEEDRYLFDKTEHIEAFDYVYEQIDRNEQRMLYFRNNTWRANDIAHATNENTKSYYGWIESFYSEIGLEIEPSELPQRMSNTSLTIISELLRDNMSGYIIMTLQLIPSSLVSSIFIQPDSLHGVCYFITFILFLATLVGMFICYKKGIKIKYIVPMLLTLLIMFTNAVVVNFLFYGQQRYVIYTFGLFYVSWVIMLKGIKDNYDQKKIGANQYSM